MQESSTEHSSDRRGDSRNETRIAARYSADGQRWANAMLVSLGVGGAFLETHRTLDAGTRVLLELDPFDALLDDGLGDPELLLRLPAEIAYLDRRNGTDVVPGLGLRIPPLTDDFAERITSMLERNPGAAATGVGGTMCWPLGIATEAPAEGLSLQAEAGWQSIAPGTSPQQTVARLLELASRNLEGSVSVAHDGRRLLPTAGVPAVALLTESTLHAMIHALLAQVALIDALREHAFERLEACHLDLDRAKQALLEAHAERDGHDFGDAVAHLDQLERARAQWTWTMRSIASMERAPVAPSAVDLEWLVEGPVEGEFVSAPTPRPSEPKPSESTLLRIAVSVAAGVLVGLMGVTQMHRLAGVESREQVGPLEFQDLLPLEEVEVHGSTLRAVVHAWSERSPSEQQARMTQVCIRADAWGFDRVELRTPRGTHLASCDGAVSTIASET